MDKEFENELETSINLDNENESEKTSKKKNEDGFLDRFEKRMEKFGDNIEEKINNATDKFLEEELSHSNDENQTDMQNNKRHRKSKIIINGVNPKKYEADIKELKDQIKKLIEDVEFEKKLKIADIANLTKKRIEQEHHIRKYGASNLATDLIRPFELLKGVVNSSSDVPEVHNYLIGFNMIVNQMQTAFEANGIKQMNVKVGDDFDSHKHEANESVDAPDFSPHKVVQVISDGYMIHDRVLVHALVKVSK